MKEEHKCSICGEIADIRVDEDNMTFYVCDDCAHIMDDKKRLPDGALLLANGMGWTVFKVRDVIFISGLIPDADVVMDMKEWNCFTSVIRCADLTLNGEEE